MKIRSSAILLFLFSFTLAAFGQSRPSESGAVVADSFFQPVKWRCIGPFRGGRSVSACGVIGDPLTYYMGATGGGLWKTTDAGQHWHNISDGYFQTGSVGAIAVAKSDPNIVYCGMGEHAPRGVMTSYGDGVYKSTDAGKTWQKAGLDASQHIARIIIHPRNPDIVYVAAQGALYGRHETRGLFRSTDGGRSWSKILYVDDRTGCSELSMDPNNPLVLYAAMWEHQRLPWKVISGGPGSGLYKSTDGGDTWKKIHNGLPEEKGKMAVSVCPSHPDRVYALIESDSEQEKGGLFVSTDAGKNWSRVSKDHRLVQRAWYYTEVFADPQDEFTVYVLSAPALRSIDGGNTWETLSGTHGDYHDLWINPGNPRNMVIANDGGAAITFNRGESWSTQENMPTAQFYRVAVDNAFPYRIYGGQQDNTSVRIAHREFNSSGIYEPSWTSSAGGESAFLAFDPDDPRYVLGGSYLGAIEVFDSEAEAGTNIMAAPIQYLAMNAGEMKYRYNWNAPIIRSQHEPNTFYHAAQHLLRTRDQGVTWEEVSPDLSKNEKEKQGKGGGPYTNEIVGAENYGTISYVTESPHEAGVLWVGTDDGLVQLTRDGGQTWKNVTPRGLSECLVNAIDISPHDPATAYIATTRYKFNDYQPGLYKTNDYGQTWADISQGIPEGAYTRVVREDNERRGLLLAGTETGVYVSWNDGEAWQPLQLNLPVTPINDLIIAHGDVIVATSGRSFWILDDLALLRQYEAASVPAFQLYRPEAALLANGRSELDRNDPGFTGSHPLRGVNPANGAVLYYQLPEATETTELTLEIRDEQGRLVRTFSSIRDSTFQSYAGGPPAVPVLSKNARLNRFVWDLRHPTLPGVPEVYIEGSYRGHKVSPGRYNMTLQYGERKATTQLEVRPNPQYPTTSEEYHTYHRFMLEMESALTEMHETVNALSDLRTKLNAVLAHLAGEKQHAALKKEGHALVQRITEWDEAMVQRKSKAYDDVENFPNKFTANYLFLINQTESDIPRVNQASRDRRAELDARWAELRETAKALLESDIPAFDEALWQAGIGALWQR